MKEYRKHFVKLNMTLIGAVLLLTLTALCGYMIHGYYRNLESTMKEVLRPLNSNAGDRFFERFWSDYLSPSVPGGTAGGAAGEEAPDYSAMNILVYDSYFGTLNVFADDLVLGEDALSNAVPKIVSGGNGFGKLNDYGIYYYSTGRNGYYKIVIASRSYLRTPITRLVLVFGGIFAAAMILFFLISRQISKLAVRPLEESMEREKQFIADASHDLKTPLTVILANAGILQSCPESTVGAQMQWVESTRDAADNMQKLINQMLSLSYLDSSDHAPEAEDVNLSSAAEAASLQMEPVAYESGIELVTDLQEEIHVKANRAALQKTVSSLIENALKYEPAGGSIRVSLAEERGYALLTVRNPGGYIPPEDLPHVFERFYRSDKTRTEKDGHGLGLAIAKRTTELMGGTISAESDSLQGTAVTLKFRIL